mmetsp:Transcript_9418/g.20889  ORF Transcript_9418/g.20889 Transcript_9418/m.20889 type:complete len:81 (-) Transcript_9418:1054-1296(-)
MPAGRSRTARSALDGGETGMELNCNSFFGGGRRRGDSARPALRHPLSAVFRVVPPSGPRRATSPPLALAALLRLSHAVRR